MIKTTKVHMATNIEGMLRQYKRRKIDFCTDENGRTMTDKEARAEIAKLQALGHKLIPCGDCEGFDPFGGGCPGHDYPNDNAGEPNPDSSENPALGGDSAAQIVTDSGNSSKEVTKH